MCVCVRGLRIKFFSLNRSLTIVFVFDFCSFFVMSFFAFFSFVDLIIYVFVSLQQVFCFLFDCRGCSWWWRRECIDCHSVAIFSIVMHFESSIVFMCCFGDGLSVCPFDVNAFCRLWVCLSSCVSRSVSHVQFRPVQWRFLVVWGGCCDGVFGVFGCVGQFFVNLFALCWLVDLHLVLLLANG